MTFILPGDPIEPSGSSSSSSSSLKGITTFGPGLVPLLPSSSASTTTTAKSSSTSAPSSSSGGAGPSRTHGSKSTSTGVVAARAGVLIEQEGKDKGKRAGSGVASTGGGAVWIEGSSKRYIPAARDLVLGTIIARHAEGYRVDIGSAGMATLDALAFEGATKRSKPNLKVGTLIYARVSSATKDMDPELECFDPATGKSDGFGELKDGLMITCSLQLSRALLTPRNPLLSSLSSVIPFEIAIGLNGRVWLKSNTVAETIALKRIIEGVDDGSVPLESGKIHKVARAFMA